jgi:hypothetical protein
MGYIEYDKVGLIDSKFFQKNWLSMSILFFRYGLKKELIRIAVLIISNLIRLTDVKLSKRDMATGRLAFHRCQAAQGPLNRNAIKSIGYNELG